MSKRGEWCQEIRWLDGRWRQTGPVHLMWDVKDVPYEQKFCEFCAAPRPVEPKTLEEKFNDTEFIRNGEKFLALPDKLASIAKSHYIELLDGQEEALFEFLRIDRSYIAIVDYKRASRTIIDFLKGRL